MTVNALNNQALITYQIKTDGRYQINFPFLEIDDYIKVYLIKVNGARELLILDQDYYISQTNGLNGIYGYVHLTKRMDFSYSQICIYRSIENDQDIPFEDNQTLFASAIEKSLDKLTMLYQDNYFKGKNNEYKEGQYITIGEDNVISADRGVEYTSGDNISIFGNVISCDVLNAVTSEKTDDLKKLIPIDRIPYQYDYVSICFYKGVFFAIANKESIITYSKDGIIWNTETGEENKIPILPKDKLNWSFIRAGEDVLLALNNRSLTQYYLDFENEWKKVTVPEAPELSKIVWKDVIYSSECFLALCDAGIFRFRYEENKETKIIEFVCKRISVKAVDDTEVDCAKINCLSCGFVKDHILFVAMGDQCLYTAIRDKTDTELAFTGAGIEANEYNFLSACFGNDEFHALAKKTDAQIIVKYALNDKKEWKLIDITEVLAAEVKYNNIFYADRTFFVTSYNNNVLTTFKELDSASQSHENYKFPFKADWCDIAYGINKFIFIHRYKSVEIEKKYETKGVYTSCVGTGGIFRAVTDKICIKYEGKGWEEENIPLGTILGNWRSVTYSADKGMYVAVSSDGKVMHSTSCKYWEDTEDTILGNWYSVTYAAGKFVAVGDNAAMYSEDGVSNWTTATISGSWQSVTYGKDKFWAVGDGVAMHSEDGIKWTPVTVSVTGNWRSVTYAADKGKDGKGLFVAVGGNAAVDKAAMYSSDGVTWTKGINVKEGLWRSVTYTVDKGMFVAVGDNAAMHSADGSNWTKDANVPEGLWRSVTRPADGGMYVAVGDNAAMHSSDGVTWTKGINVKEGLWRSVTYAVGKGMYVAVGDGVVMHSLYGIEWIQYKLLDIIYISDCDNKHIVTTKNLEISHVLHKKYYDTDWNYSDIDFAWDIKSFAHDNNMYVGVGKKLVWSKFLDVFTTFKGSDENDLELGIFNHIIFADNKLYAGGSKKGTDACLIISYDSNEWKEEISSVNKGSIIQIAYGNNILIAVADNGDVLVKDKDKEWKNYHTEYKFKSIIFDLRRFIAITDTLVLTTYDGASWIESEIGNNNYICSSSGEILIVGDDKQAFLTSGYENVNNFCSYDLVRYLRDEINYKAGNGINISDKNIISLMNIIEGKAVTAGDLISIEKDIEKDEHKISCKLIAGTNVTFGTEKDSRIPINATDTKYTAGDKIRIDGEDNKISCTLTPGKNIQIDDSGIISATDTKYTAGDNVSIDDSGIISATDTKYTAGDNVSIKENKISFAIINGFTFNKVTQDIQSDLFSVTYAVGMFVAVGGGTVIISNDGIKWTPVDNVPAGAWNSVTYAADKGFVAVGYNVTMYSEDGVSKWTKGANIPGSWFSVTYGKDKGFVAVENGAVMHSTDGIVWDPVAYISGNWRSVTYAADKGKDGKGLFVAIGERVAMRSTDGINWDLGAYITGNWTSVTYAADKGMYVAVGINTAMYSEDGIKWSPATTITGAWQSVTYAVDKFVAVAHDGKAVYSTDGIEWTPVANVPEGLWRSVTYAEGKFLAVGGGAVMRSEDTYTSDVLEALYIDNGSYYRDFIYKTIEIESNLWHDLATTRAFGKDYFMAFAKDVNNSRIAISGDYGETWKYIKLSDKIGTAAYPTEARLAAISAANGIFVVLASTSASSFAFLSYDAGETWEKSETQNLSGVISIVSMAHSHIGGVYAALSYGDYPQVYSIDNGRSWAKSTSPQKDKWISLTYGDTNFVGVSDDGTKSVISYNNGANWFQFPTGFTGTLRSITFGLNTYVAVGGDTVIISNDGVRWEKIDLGEGLIGTNFTSIAYGNGVFIAAATGGHVYISKNCGKNWKHMYTFAGIGEKEIRALIYSNGTFMAAVYAHDHFIKISIPVTIKDVLDFGR